MFALLVKFIESHRKIGKIIVLTALLRPEIKENTVIEYRKSLKETRGSYYFFEAPNAGLILGRVSLTKILDLDFFSPEVSE